MTSPEPAGVRFDGLTKIYPDGTEAVRDLTLAVARGEFFGFLGPNGAGKSTTVRMACGLTRPTRGRALILGVDPVERPLEVKARVGLMPEEIETYERLSGRELLVFTGRMYGLPKPEAARRAEELLDFMEIDPADRGKLVLDYSTGMRKKTLLAAALIHGPQVLFLDEPFSGIDVPTSRAIRDMLVRAAEGGTTIFFSSHVLDLAERLCTRFGVIDRGRLVAAGDLPALRAAAGAPAAAGLEDVFLSLVGRSGERGDLSFLAG